MLPEWEWKEWHHKAGGKDGVQGQVPSGTTVKRSQRSLGAVVLEFLLLVS